MLLSLFFYLISQIFIVFIPILTTMTSIPLKLVRKSGGLPLSGGGGSHSDLDLEFPEIERIFGTLLSTQIGLLTLTVFRMWGTLLPPN